MRTLPSHRLAEARSLALHRVVAARLLADPSIVERARTRTREAAAAGRMHPEYAARWEAILAQDAAAVADAITRDDEEAASLRQTTPFTFVVGPRERWGIWRRTREEMEGEP